MNDEVDSAAHSVGDAQLLAALLKPLANPRRLELLAFLRQPHYLEEIASFLRVSRQAATEHVKDLQAMGLLTRRTAERPGKNVIEYSLAIPALFNVYEYFERLVVQMIPPAGNPLATQLRRAPPGKVGVVPHAEPSLIVVHGLELGRQMPLGRARGELSWTIGRAPGCQVRVDHDTFISGRHAEIRLAKVGDEYRLVDAFSRNGTLLNWNLLAPGEPSVLRHGDVVGIGRTLLLFRKA